MGEAYALQSDLVWITLFIWAIPLFINRKYIQHGIYNNNNSYTLIFLLLVIYATFAFAEADTYHYHEMYDTMVRYNYRVHVEQFYFKLVKIIPNSYWLWRFAIWGVAAYIIIIVLRKNQISPLCISIMAPLLFFRQFAITRGSLGFAVMMLAITLVMSKSKNIKLSQMIIGGILLGLSLYLHRSIAIYILLLPVAYVFKLNKFTFYLSIIAFPFLYGMVKMLVDNILGTTFFSEETLNFVETYSEDTGPSTTLWGYVGQLINYAPIFYLFYLLTKYYIINKNRLTNVHFYFLKLSYILFYVFCLFYEQEFSSFMSSRSLHAAMFPLLIISSKYLDDSGLNKQNKCMIMLLILSSLYWYLYLIYSWS